MNVTGAYWWLSPAIARWQCFHPVCLCVSVCLCLSRCLSGWFNYEGLVPHKPYFAVILLGMSSCASYVSRTHDVIDDFTRSQSRPNFEIEISPSIFELEHRSKAPNIGNANGYLSGIFKFRYNFRVTKFVTSSKWRPFFKFWIIEHSFNLTPDMKRLFQIMPKKFFSWWWRHRVASKSALYIRRSKAQDIGNANGYLSGIFNFRYNFQWKSLSQAQKDGYFKNFEILNTTSIWPQIWKDRSKSCPKKFFFMMMTSSMTSKGGLKVSLYIHV